MGPLAVFAIFAVLIVVSIAALGFALVVARSASRPRPAIPLNCGDCVFMIPRAKVYRQEAIEDADGLVHYLCENRWMEIPPHSQRCDIGRRQTSIASS